MLHRPAPRTRPGSRSTEGRAAVEWLIAGGELGELIRTTDWSRTSFGPRDRWPQSLRTTLNLVVGGSFPMALLWGSDLLFLYNDAYRAILTDRHPRALGRSTREIWPEVWPINEPIFTAVMERGETLFFENKPFAIRRGGLLVDAYFTLSYGPVRLEDGSIGGTLVTLQETTSMVARLSESEERLRENEERLRRAHDVLKGLIDSTTDTVAAVDPDYRFLAFNEPYRREVRTIYGAELRAGDSLRDLLAQLPEDLEHAIDLFAHGLMGETMRVVQAFGDPGLERRYYELTVSPINGADGTVIGAAHIGRDITGRKQAEEALRESERRLREIFESMTEAYCVIEMIFDGNSSAVDFRYLETNPAFVRHATQPMLGKRIKEVVPDVEQFWLDHYGRVALTGEPAELEHVVAGLGDQWFHTSAFRIGGDGSRRVGVVFENITERKRAERALRESEERFRVAQELSPDGFLIFRPMRDEMGAVTDFLWIYENAAAARMNDTNPKEVCGKRVSEVLPHHDKSPFHKAYTEVAETGEVRVVEEAFYDEDTFRQRRWFRAAAVPTTDGDVAILVQNVTERKRAEEALRDALATLAEADRRKDEFIAVLSHELRNPLAPIRYALPLLGEERLGAAGRRATEVIDRQVTHLSRLVDDLLDVSRITAGKIELRRDYVALGSVVSTAVEAASPAIAAGRHSLDMSMPETPVWLHIDAARISQAITNLLNNSAKYTPQGGRIRLEATTDEAMVTIRVIDNGIGLASEALTTVFEMFRQGSDRNRAQGGLGVGLTLAKQLVEMHGGAIDAHSEGPGHGAEFVIRLPLAAAAGPANEEQAPTASSQPACLRVLVVDDNVDLVDMLAMVVEAAGHQVRKAFDGRSAISAALEYQPHLILLDVGMPDMNGMEVAKELRRHASLARTRIVALTGWGQAEDRRRTAEAGFDGHLTKPADPRQIQRILEEEAQRVKA